MTYIIAGKYLYVDSFNTKINEKNKYLILDIINKNIQKEKGILGQGYKQGLIEIPFYNETILFLDILNNLSKYLLHYVMNKSTLEEVFLNTKNEISKMNIKNKAIKIIINRIYTNIESQVFFESLNKRKKYFLQFHKADINVLLNIPKNVVGVVYNNYPKASVIDIINSKKVHLILNNKRLENKKDYYYDYYNLEMRSDIDSLVRDKFVNKKIDSIEVGYNLSHLESENFDLKTDFILVEPEKDYLLNGGVVNLEKRLLFYQKLYKEFPNHNIIIGLPRLDNLYEYHKINDDYLVDEILLSKHFGIYKTELEAIFTYYHPNILLMPPPVIDDAEFEIIKDFIREIILSNYNRKVKIGLNLETETSFEYLKFFKKYDFVVCNLERLIEESALLSESTEDNIIREISMLNQTIKAKKKPFYLKGERLTNQKILQKIINRGIKKYIFNTDKTCLNGSIDIKTDL